MATGTSVLHTYGRNLVQRLRKICLICVVVIIMWPTTHTYQGDKKHVSQVYNIGTRVTVKQPVTGQAEQQLEQQLRETHSGHSTTVDMKLLSLEDNRLHMYDFWSWQFFGSYDSLGSCGSGGSGGSGGSCGSCRFPSRIHRQRGTVVDEVSLAWKGHMYTASIFSSVGRVGTIFRTKFVPVFSVHFRNQGDQMSFFLKKSPTMKQNPISFSKLMHKLNNRKSSQNVGYFFNKKLPRVNNHPMCKNSPNPVTLLERSPANCREQA
jgi:hypothetical protein